MNQEKQKRNSEGPLYRLVNVKRTYMQGEVPVQALRGIDLEIEKGEFTVFVGPSGSGKTTLFNIMGALDTPTEGEVFFENQTLSNLSQKDKANKRLHRMGFVFQAYNLLPVLTAVENVEYILTLRGVSEKEKQAKSMEMLEVVGLAEMADRRPSQLSGGQQQRVAIARAMVGKPDVILADEPTANLDTATSDDVMHYMEQINQKYGTTFLFSTHDNRVVDRARRVITIRDGQVD